MTAAVAPRVLVYRLIKTTRRLTAGAGNTTSATPGVLRSARPSAFATRGNSSTQLITAMAKLKSITFKGKAETGETLEFVSQAAVSDSGVFSLTFPDYLATVAQEAARKEPRVTAYKPVTHWRVEARVLEYAQHFLQQVVNSYMASETTVERVILYHYQNDTAAALDNHGNVHPNGYFAAAASSDGKYYEWGSNSSISSNNQPEQFSVGLWARVYDKWTYTRPTGSTILYKRPDVDNFGSSLVHQLNGFIMRAPSDFKGQHPNELPYTEENAEFFVRTLIAITRLGMQMQEIVGNPANLALTIQAKGAPLTLEAPRS